MYSRVSTKCIVVYQRNKWISANDMNGRASSDAKTGTDRNGLNLFRERFVEVT
jgi:hypothetical protein